jgi:hypothetical protein
MRMITIKVNPAFKLTQPLPLLTAEFAQHAGRAAMSVARGMPLANAWGSARLDEADRAGVVRSEFKSPVMGMAA